MYLFFPNKHGECLENDKAHQYLHVTKTMVNYIGGWSHHEMFGKAFYVKNWLSLLQAEKVSTKCFSIRNNSRSQWTNSLNKTFFLLKVIDIPVIIISAYINGFITKVRTKMEGIKWPRVFILSFVKGFSRCFVGEVGSRKGKTNSDNRTMF